jgi:two-component system, LytTR family, sensor kinase
MKHQRILLHIGFWLAYGLYDGYLNAPLSGTSYAHLGFGERMMLGYSAEMLVLAFKIPTTYFVLYWLVPMYFRTKKLPILLLSLALLTVAATFLSQSLWIHVIYPFIYQVSSPEPVATFARKLFRFLWSSIDILLLLSVASALKFFRLRQKAAERERQLIAEKLQSELNFLRAQTNPHFLFNTLNNLYHLARKRSEDTPDAILKLSDLLRFMLYECTTPRIRISQEEKVIRDYLELEGLRYGDRLRAEFSVELDDEDQHIAPLLLLPFVENAFKHGASESRGETWVRIILKVKNGSLSFQVENPKDPTDQAITEGIGLKNVKRQLELIYPNHKLSLENQGDRFIVNLKIPLND